MNSLLSRDIISIWNGNMKIFSCHGETDRENKRWFEIFSYVISQHNESILYEGYIFKKGSFVKNWKYRYGVLTVDKLIYYSYQTKTNSYQKKGEIDLDLTTTIHLLPDTSSHQNRFSITTRLPSQSNHHRQSSRILYISVVNQERREEWVTALREAVSQHTSNSQSRHSAFALMSDHGPPGWMNAMFEDDLLASLPPSATSPVSPDEKFYHDQVSGEERLVI
jgi:hypothetical protein